MEEETELTVICSSEKNTSTPPKESLSLAVTTVNEQLNKAIHVVKVTKWKFVSIPLSLIVLQLLQMILIQTATIPEEESKWLFTGFSIITIGFKLLEELWPFRKQYIAAKKDVPPLWEVKHKMEYTHMATISGGKVVDTEEMLLQILSSNVCREKTISS